MSGDEAATPEPQAVECLSEEEFLVREKAFELIFEPSTSQKLREASRKERKEKDPPWEEEQSKSFSYSEMSLKELHRLLNQVKDTPLTFGSFNQAEGTFLDLGSGAGKACIGTALLHPFKKVIGIELLDCLGDATKDAQTAYGDAEKLATLETPLPEGMHKPEIEFIKADFVAEFDEKVAPLGPELQVCFANATCFGEQQMKAMVKLANLMPDGSLFITVTQKLPEYLIIDLDRDPKQRHAVALKREIQKAGKDPRGLDIIPAPAVNDPKGWREVLEQELELEWGKTSVYVFRKLGFPYCEEGDLCMASPAPPKKEKKEGDEGEPQEEEPPIKEMDLEYYLTVYKRPVEVPLEDGSGGTRRVDKWGWYLDDPFQEPKEMIRMEPLTAKRLENYHAQYMQALQVVEAELQKSPDPALQALPADSLVEIRYTAIEVPTADSPVVPTDEVKEYGQSLLATCEAFASEAWAPRLVERDFPAVCKEVDTENTGKVSGEGLHAAWRSMRERLVDVIRMRLDYVDKHELMKQKSET